MDAAWLGQGAIGLATLVVVMLSFASKFVADPPSSVHDTGADGPEVTLAPIEWFEVERDTRMSNSMLWPLSRLNYVAEGQSAWMDKGLPYPPPRRAMPTSAPALPSHVAGCTLRQLLDHEQ